MDNESDLLGRDPDHARLDVECQRQLSKLGQLKLAKLRQPKLEKLSVRKLSGIINRLHRVVDRIVNRFDWLIDWVINWIDRIVDRIIDRVNWLQHVKYLGVRVVVRL